MKYIGILCQALGFLCAIGIFRNRKELKRLVAKYELTGLDEDAAAMAKMSRRVSILLLLMCAFFMASIYLLR